MNRIDSLFQTKKKKVLSIYFTAGFPYLESVEKIILLLEKNGADMVEIGIPYSDPLADGPVIQETSKVAIANGMTIINLFKQIREIRKKCSIPLLLMGYLNPILQFGFTSFCKNAAGCGIDGLIIPELPPDEFRKSYAGIVKEHNLKSIFLITPDSTDMRINEIDDISTGFLYLVSSASTTGTTSSFGDGRLASFERIASMRLKNPLMVGFGVHDRETLGLVHKYVEGAIIGSAYLRSLSGSGTIEEDTERFFRLLK
jgi:tryptophan synthase alpha chain